MADDLEERIHRRQAERFKISLPELQTASPRRWASPCAVARAARRGPRPAVRAPSRPTRGNRADFFCGSLPNGPAPQRCSSLCRVVLLRGPAGAGMLPTDNHANLNSFFRLIRKSSQEDGCRKSTFRPCVDFYELNKRDERIPRGLPQIARKKRNKRNMSAQPPAPSWQRSIAQSGGLVVHLPGASGRPSSTFAGHGGHAKVHSRTYYARTRR